jgi:hypothetical protein
MNKIVTLLFLLISNFIFSQFTTVNPDTVCFNSPTSTYQVPSFGPGFTYNWTVLSPGVITSGLNTNSINVNWSAATSGLITNAVTLIVTNSSGCNSLPVSLNVFIYQINLNITSINPLCSTNNCVTLSATPIGGTWSGNGVNGSQFCPSASGVGTFQITYTINQGGCTFSNSTIVVVNPAPTLSPIQHD